MSKTITDQMLPFDMPGELPVFEATAPTVADLLTETDPVLTETDPVRRLKDLVYRDVAGLGMLVGQAAVMLRYQNEAEAEEDWKAAERYANEMEAYRHSTQLVAGNLLGVPFSDARWAFKGTLRDTVYALICERRDAHLWARRNAG